MRGGAIFDVGRSQDTRRQPARVREHRNVLQHSPIKHFPFSLEREPDALEAAAGRAMALGSQLTRATRRLDEISG